MFCFSGSGVANSDPMENKIALNLPQMIAQDFVITERHTDADGGIEFVHCAVTLQAGVVFSNPRTGKEPRLATIACLCVNFHFKYGLA